MATEVIKFFGCRKKSKCRICFLAFAVAFLFLAFVQYGFSVISKDYVPIPAHVTDITSETEYRRRGKVTFYYYNVHYSYNGTNYRKALVSGDAPDMNMSEVWIDPNDPTEVVTADSGTMRNISLVFLLGGIACFVVWLVLYRMAETLPYNSEIAGNVFITSCLCTVLSAFAVLLCTLVVNNDHDFASKSMFVLSAVILLCSGNISIMAKKEERRLTNR